MTLRDMTRHFIDVVDNAQLEENNLFFSIFLLCTFHINIMMKMMLPDITENINEYIDRFRILSFQ